MDYRQLHDFFKSVSHDSNIHGILNDNFKPEKRLKIHKYALMIIDIFRVMCLTKDSKSEKPPNINFLIIIQIM